VVQMLDLITYFSSPSARGPRLLVWLPDPYRKLAHPEEQPWSFQSAQRPNVPFASFHLKK